MGATKQNDKNAINMTEGNVYRHILLFAIPVFISQLFQQLYNSVDSLIVGQYLGKEALAAVSSSGSLIHFLTSFVIGTMQGAGVIVSRFYGADDEKTVAESIHTTVVFGLLAGVFVTVLGVGLTPTLLRWMGTAETVLPHSISYFRLYFAGGISIVMYNAFRSIMTSLGDSRRPLIYLILSSVLNVILDWLFVGVMGYGVGSAAVATTVSQTVSALLCLGHLTDPALSFRLRWRELRMSPRILREIVRCGVPAGVQNSVIGLANVLVQTNINSFGEDAMAACGSYFKLEGFVFLPITSFSMALTTFIGQNLGAGKHDRAKEGARFGLISSCVLTEIIGVLMIVFAAPLIGLFTKDADVIAIGVREIRTEALFYFLLSFDHCIAGICRGAGKASVPMVIMLSIWCVVRIIYITVAMRISHQIHLLFWAYPLTWGISAVMFLWYYLKSDWVHGFDKRI